MLSKKIKLVTFWARAFTVVLGMIMLQVESVDPIARHSAFVVAKNTDIVINLPGFDADGDKLIATITTLPTSGSLHQLTATFNNYGYEPKTGTLIDSIGTIVSGRNNRIIFSPPSNQNAPTGAWDTFKYTVNDGTSTSNVGIISLVSQNSVLVGSTFDKDVDGWSIIDNGSIISATYEASSRGALNHYIWSRDQEINLNKLTQTDKKAWKFQAPTKFLGNHVVSYGGSLQFWISSASGDFSLPQRNSKQELVELVCDTCASQTGIRLVRRIDSEFSFNGSPTHINIPLYETSWLKDSKNTIVPFTHPTVCELAEVLEGLTAVRILGDFTQWYETVSIDNVLLKHGPGIPVGCYDVLD